MSRVFHPTRTVNAFRSRSNRKPRVFMFGRQEDGGGWHPLYSLRKLDQTFARLGLKEILVPNLTAPNREVAHRSSFKGAFNDEGMSVRVRNGSVSNAVVLGEKGRGVAMFVDEQPIGLFLFPSGRTITTVCSRDTMLDHDMVLAKPKASLHQVLNNSIVSAAIRKADHWEPAARIQAFFTLGVSQESFAHPWDDPAHGQYNQNMTKIVEERFPKADCFGGHEIIEGRLNLFRLFKAQCMALGLRDENVIADNSVVDEPNRTLDMPRRWCDAADGPDNKNLFVAVTL